jgi:acetyl CoA:N6-hydroxylysine acetyl transferase
MSDDIVSMFEGASRRQHPVRPEKPVGVIYQRSIDKLKSELTLRTIDRVADLPRFHRWMNDPRVAAFWEQAGSLDEQAAYLDKVARDAHTLPVLACLDGHPLGYFELYWAKEDRIAPYYQVDDYDRGLHMLVGEQHHRGPDKVEAWLTSLVHYMFLDEPRTQNIVAEPRHDNAKMIGYLERAGFSQEKVFDFPHKRAALMILPRKTFFDRTGL